MTNITKKVLQADKGYNSIIEQGEAVLLEITKRGVNERADILLEKYTPQILEIENQLKAHATAQFEKAQKELQSARVQFKNAVYEDPAQEALRREDFKARLSLFTADELEDYIASVDPNSLTVFDLSLIDSEARDKFEGKALERVAEQLEALRNTTALSPEAAQDVEERFSMWNALKMVRQEGKAWLHDSEHDEFFIRDYYGEFKSIIEAVQKKDAHSGARSDLKKRWGTYYPINK